MQDLLPEQLPDSPANRAPNISRLLPRSSEAVVASPPRHRRWRRPAVVIGISAASPPPVGLLRLVFHCAGHQHKHSFLLQHSHSSLDTRARKSPLSVPQVHRRR